MDWEELGLLIERFWPNVLEALVQTCALCAVGGVIGVLLVMLVARRGFSGLEGAFHITVVVPFSSAVIGAVLWVATWLLVWSMTEESMRPQVMREISYPVAVLVSALQAYVWILFIRLGLQ